MELMDIWDENKPVFLMVWPKTDFIDMLEYHKVMEKIILFKNTSHRISLLNMGLSHISIFNPFDYLSSMKDRGLTKQILLYGMYKEDEDTGSDTIVCLGSELLLSKKERELLSAITLTKKIDESRTFWNQMEFGLDLKPYLPT